MNFMCLLHYALLKLCAKIAEEFHLSFYLQFTLAFNNFAIIICPNKNLYKEKIQML